MIALRYRGLTSQAVGELAIAIALVAALIVAFARPLASMVELWSASPMYSYGFTVPVVSAYLLWTRRHRMAVLQPLPARFAGATVLVLAGVLILVGRAGSIQVLEQIAFLIAIVGAMLLVLGWGYLKVGWAAVAYLLLMVPIWDAFTEPLHLPFQNQSAALSVGMLRAAGIPAYREATFVALPGITLEVARACSGVNYLVAVLALGLPLSYLYLSSNWRRAMLIGAALAIAALSNGLRVTVIGILAYFNVGSPLHGPFHMLHGLFVAGIGYAVLFGGLRLLAPKVSQPPAPPDRNPIRKGLPWRLPRIEIALVFLTFLVFGAVGRADSPRPVALRTSLERLPTDLDGWKWDRLTFSAPETRWPGADAQVQRRYRSPDGHKSVDIYVAYFGSQEQNKEIVSHRSDDLHRRARAATISSDGDARDFAANVVGDSADHHSALFWYDVGSAETSPVRVKVRTLWNVLVHRRNNGAVIMLTSNASTEYRTTTREVEHLALQVRNELEALLPNR